MKFNPTAGTEEQTSWFGKRGLSWHIAVVHQKRQGDFYSKAYIHVLGQSAQGQEEVTALVTDTLQRLMKTSQNEGYPINKVYIRSDNAGICLIQTIIFLSH